MTLQLEYSTVLTGAAFMLYEMKQIAQLVDRGLGEKEIREKVLVENIFQYEKLSSIKRALPYIIKRVSVLDEHLRKQLTEQSLQTAKVINLYTIMKSDRLFFEFMDEVIREKLQKGDFQLEKKDINTYFIVKAEQSEFLSGCSENTIQKLKQVFKKILLETGILQDLKSGELSPIIVEESLKNYIKQIGDGKIIDAMGEE